MKNKFEFNYSENEIQTYVQMAISEGNYEEALKFLESIKERIDHSPEGYNYQIIKAHINTYFLIKSKNGINKDNYLHINEKLNTDCREGPVKWKWNSLEKEDCTNWLCSDLGIGPGPVQLLCSYSNAGKSVFSSYFAACVIHNLKVMSRYEIQDPGPCIATFRKKY
jgi:hypothetical protein